MQEAGLGGRQTRHSLLDVLELGHCLAHWTEVPALHIPQERVKVAKLPLKPEAQLPSATARVASLPIHVLTLGHAQGVDDVPANEQPVDNRLT